MEQVHAAGDGMEILHLQGLQGEEVSGIGFDRAKIKGNDLNRFFQLMGGRVDNFL